MDICPSGAQKTQTPNHLVLISDWTMKRVCKPLDYFIYTSIVQVTLIVANIFILHFTTCFAQQRKEMFDKNTLNTFCLQFYGITQGILKDHSDSKRKPTATTWAILSILATRALLHACTIPQIGLHIPQPCYTSCGALVGTRNSSMGP